ncbi:glycosyltransferase family 4 protein [Microbacterium sp. zg.Y1090]|uniref:glycosyltransferase family 4 protein n=1 Tax=Microbacterium TaxID=33882 RepID=UPI00214D121E|nr:MULTISPECIES: glycosyltransferase family 4 protein [unclassified Microbacterium]MCR2814124.1 glycosyltransferase family 4 protein [Microbacterium sp. zg.Y1084]MCR2817871.1 glycosyltransferase family 4 protein [Microbacterium sp. zg.Y1090]MDL5487725.1 glycosyltransferase family 4 protein [Microbacterium sp. zg-Y1211]WIM27959.1 glycosyltransferase family 4 protein [Microbacterium sp. zg-Y1090]
MLAAAPVRRSRSGAVAFTWDENSAARLAFSRGVGTRYCGVVWLTDAVDREGPQALAPMRRALRKMDGVWVLSAAQVQPLREFLGPAGPPVHHVLFGIDEAFFTAHPYPERPLVVSVGGDRDRDAATLFQALERIRAQRPDVEIVVQSTSTAPPPSGVRVVPYLTHAELRNLYARASVAVIATRDNSHVSGMTVGLEVMSTGRPIVITETAGMDDYFTPEGGAALVPLGDAAALSDHALALLNDPAGAARAGAAARRRVESTFTTRHLASRLAALARRSV